MARTRLTSTGRTIPTTSLRQTAVSAQLCQRDVRQRRAVSAIGAQPRQESTHFTLAQRGPPVDSIVPLRLLAALVQQSDQDRVEIRLCSQVAAMSGKRQIVDPGHATRRVAVAHRPDPGRVNVMCLPQQAKGGAPPQYVEINSE